MSRGQKLSRFHSQSDNNSFDCCFRRLYFEASIFRLIVFFNDSAYLIARKKNFTKLQRDISDKYLSLVVWPVSWCAVTSRTCKCCFCWFFFSVSLTGSFIFSLVCLSRLEIGSFLEQTDLLFKTFMSKAEYDGAVTPFSDIGLILNFLFSRDNVSSYLSRGGDLNLKILSRNKSS